MQRLSPLQQKEEQAEDFLFFCWKEKQKSEDFLLINYSVYFLSFFSYF
jgi:hypothetical protein